MLIVNGDKVVSDTKDAGETLLNFGLVTAYTFDLLLDGTELCPREVKEVMLEVFSTAIDTQMKERFKEDGKAI